MIFAGVPDLSVTLTAQAVDGDTIWTEWAMDGTRTDDTGYHLRGVVIFTVAEGRATGARFYLEPVESDTDMHAFIAALLAT